MQTTVSFAQRNGNTACYCYDYKKKQYFVVHPFLGHLIDSKSEVCDEESNVIIECDNQDDCYYREKYRFLKDQGFFEEKKMDKQANGLQLTPTMIETILENLNHIVFEVTDACNLNCEYCGYGNLYYDHDKRENKQLAWESVVGLMEYLLPYLTKSDGSIYFGFYGGEPLLNMQLIKQSVSYIKQLLPMRDVRFTMTTNAVLLDKYMDYLAENQFRLLISFDGDREGHSYRAFHNSKNSFDVVYSNVKILQKKYPDYFDEYVSFNSVIHNRNSVAKTDAFFTREFGKSPKFSPLDDAGIRPEKMEKFKQMYHGISKEMQETESQKELVAKRFINDPFVFWTALFMKGKLAYLQYDSYEDLFATKKRFLGGTCLPFQKKLFLTVNNKILPCERIDQKQVLGTIQDGNVYMDFEKIAKKYNWYYKVLEEQCKLCYRSESCSQCFFQIDNFETNQKCHALMNRQQLSKELSSVIDFIENNPEIPERIINEVILK